MGLLYDGFPCHYPSAMEALDEGNDKGVRRDVGISDIIVIMDEETLSQVGDK